MGDLKLKTDKKLLDALKGSSSRKLSASEVHAQRVSYVYASMKPGSSMTKDRVKQMLEEQEGVATECAGGPV